MACGSLVRWTAIPVGSRFILETQGDDNLFHATATVALNGAAQPNLEHDAIVGGTAILDIDATKQKWTIEPVVILTGNASPPIQLFAKVVDASGAPVQVPDGAGGRRPAECDWQTGTTAGSMLAIQIQLRSVLS